MSQPRKILRLAEEERKGTNTGGEKSGSLSSRVVPRSIETLVFETAIPLFKDVKLLNFCRLVSKEWNSQVCPRLRAISKTSLQQRHPDNLGFNALKCLVENRNSGLPSPFNFHILLTPFSNEPFWNFVKYIMQEEDLFLSGLTLHMWGEGWNQSTNKRMASFLLSNRTNKKLVQMKIIESVIPNLDVFPHDQIRFLHLKEIEVHTPVVDREVNLFFQNILLHSPLETMRLVFFKTPGIPWMFRSGSFGNVTKLFIKCDGNVLLPEDWDHLIRLRMPKVRELAFKDLRCARDLTGHAHLHAAMLSNAAGTVESLRGNVIPFDMLSTFPKLREIDCLIRGTEFLEVTSKRFPSLKRITFQVSINSCSFAKAVCPHFGVERIELGVKRYGGGVGYDPERVHYQDLLHRALRCSSSQFPNVVELKLGSRFNRLTSSLLATVHACFPRLKVLELCGMKGDFGALSGYEVNVERWLEFGFPLEMAALHCSLQSFENLEKVILGQEISVSEHLVKYCLSKVVKLKYLEFVWEEGLLSPETIRDYLGHVELIRMSKCSFFKKKPLEEKVRILAMLPRVFMDHE